MRILPFSCKTILLVLALLIAAATVTYGAPKSVEVAVHGECMDCVERNVQLSHAFKGLKVTIDCRHANGEIKTRASGELDEAGKFRVNFPSELVEDGKLKEECRAQLHDASNAPCPSHNGLKFSKLSSSFETSDDKHTFSPIAKLKFASATCASAFLWPHYPKKSFPKIPFSHFKKPFTFPPIWKKPLPPIPHIKKPCPPLVPIYKKPLPPPVPVYHKPPVPVYYKPVPPPVPVYHKPVLPPVPVYHKPPVPVYYKPIPPPVPVYHKPIPPPVPVYHKPLPPLVPKIKKPCPPIFKKKPIVLPPLPKLPPFPKKPCPPLSKPPFPKFPTHPWLKKPSWPTYPPHH